MLLSKVGSLYIAPAKLSAYLLDVSHPLGGPKARFFIRFGFDPIAPHLLQAALLRHAALFPVRRSLVRADGTNHLIDGRLESPDNRSPWVRTVWRSLPECDPYLLTAYPLKPRE